MNDVFFPTIILTYLECFRQAFSKVNYNYFKSFIWSSMLVKGRKCITNIHNACFNLEKHFSSFERFLSQNKWDINKVIKLIVNTLIRELKEKLIIHNGYLAVIDTTYNAKNSKKMPGIQKWHQHSSNADRGNSLIGHHWSILGLICNSFGRFFFFPILTRLISGKTNPFQYLSVNDGVRNVSFFDIAVSTVIQLRDLVKAKVFRVVADAYYSKQAFIQPLIESCIHVISKLRKDAVGWEVSVPKSQRGRPRKYGKKWKLADLIKLPEVKDIKVNIYGKNQIVSAIYKDLILRGIEKVVRIVVIEGINNPIILISTDLNLSMKNIIEIYSARFSIEIGIRDLKQHFGFGDYQFTTILSIFRFVQLCCVSFCIWRLSNLCAVNSDWLNDSENTTRTETRFSFSRIGRQLRRFVVKKILFQNSAINAEVDKMDNDYKNILKIVA
jgi:hypothetical protein